MSLIKDLRSDFSRLDKSAPKIASFGYLFAAVSALLGVLILLAGKFPQRSILFLAFAFVFTILARFFPLLLKPLFSVWIMLSLLIGWLMSRVLLSLVFFLVFTPISFLFKLFGKDPLNRRFDKNASTYWIKKQNTPQKDFQKQF